MNISELIEELEKVKKEHGDIEVEIQYRDDGGYYYGSDDDINFNIEDRKYGDRKVEILVL